jgi:hypothetical protein
MHPRLSRRTPRFAIGALLLLPVLSACGFDYATDRVNDITAGHTNRDYRVDVNNALIVAGQPDSGTLVGQLVNNESDKEDDNDIVLTSVTSGTDAAAAEFEPLTIPAAGQVQLHDAGIRIDGSFEAGDVYDVTLTFDNGEVVELALPVVTQCGQYEGLDDADGDGAGSASGEAYSCETEEAPEH